MNTAQKARLKKAGWRVGTAEEFLGLSREQAQLVEMKLALGEFLRRHRARRRLSQEALAERLGSSQSRIAKLEAGVRGVTLDLLFRALFATGVTAGEIGREIQHRSRSAA
jgi:ribosome-binding protein aMBF1 (putative translation factor)